MSKFYTVCPECGHKAPIEDHDLVEIQSAVIQWKVEDKGGFVDYMDHCKPLDADLTLVRCRKCGADTEGISLLECVVDENGKYVAREEE